MGMGPHPETIPNIYFFLGEMSAYIYISQKYYLIVTNSE